MASLKGELALKEGLLIDSLDVLDQKAQVVAKPKGKLEDINLNPNTLDGVTRIGLDLSGEFKAQLRDILIKIGTCSLRRIKLCQE